MAANTDNPVQQPPASPPQNVKICREQILLLRQTAESALWMLLSQHVEFEDPDNSLDELEQVATQLLNTVARLKARRSVSPLQKSGSWRALKAES